MNAAKPEVLPEPAVTPKDPLPVVDADGIAPLLALQTALRFWWLLASLMIMGGVGGWLFHKARPPVYEAVVNFSAGIDFVQTGNMTQFEEDVALNAIGDLLRSERVVNQVVDQANARGLAVDYQSLRRMTQTERKMNVQNLRVQNNDVTLAEQVANIWVEVGWATLNEAYQHAVQAERLDRYLRGLETCLEKAVVTEPTQVVCGTLRFDEVQRSLAEAGRALAPNGPPARACLPACDWVL
jgi:hypothetical protein